MFRSQLRKNIALTRGTERRMNTGACDRGWQRLRLTPWCPEGSHHRGRLLVESLLTRLLSRESPAKALACLESTFPAIHPVSFLFFLLTPQPLNCLPSLSFYRKHSSAVITVFSTFFSFVNNHDNLWFVYISFCETIFSPNWLGNSWMPGEEANIYIPGMSHINAFM